MTNKTLCLLDWKRWGAYIGTEYRLQLGGYNECPMQYDKIEQVATVKEPATYGLVCWIGSEGVQAKLVMTHDELAEAGRIFRLAAELAYYAVSTNGGRPFVPSRYAHPQRSEQSLWSVTEVLRYALAKDGLLGWYHKKGVEGMVELVKQNTFGAWKQEDITLEAALKVLEEKKLRPTDLRDAAGEQGRTFHKLAMLYLQGKTIDMTQAPEWQQTFLTKFAMWADKVKLEPIALETMVYQESDPAYAGTLDCLGYVQTEWVEQERARLTKKEAG